MLSARLFLGYSLIVSQGVLLQSTFAQTRPRLSARQSVAERAWPAFFKSFRSAVEKRDRVALKNMMVADFFFSAGDGDDNHDGDSRDEAFEFWDNPHVRGWQALERTLAKGTATRARWWGSSTDGKHRPGRVAPPAANIRKNTAGPRPTIDWLAFFEFREDGRWYCTSFSECCD